MRVPGIEQPGLNTGGDRHDRSGYAIVPQEFFDYAGWGDHQVAAIAECFGHGHHSFLRQAPGKRKIMHILIV